MYCNLFLDKQGRIHGRRCVRLCFLVNSGGAFVRVSVYVHERECVFARVRVWLSLVFAALLTP